MTQVFFKKRENNFVSQQKEKDWRDDSDYNEIQKEKVNEEDGKLRHW